jgi:hypothetical protein
MCCGGGHLGFPIGIKSIYFVEDLPMIIPGQFGKLHMKFHWMVLYKLQVFCSDMKFKMAATAGLNLTLDPMGKMFQNAWRRPSWISDLHKKHIFCRGPSIDHSWAVWFQLSQWFQRRSVLKHFPHKMFQNASTLKPLGQLKPNCPGMIIGRSSTRFMFSLCRSEIQDGPHSVQC